MPLICPHCSYDNAKDQEPSELPWEEEGLADLKCHGCGRPYIARAVTSIRWDTFADENDYQEHG